MNRWILSGLLLATTVEASDELALIDHSCGVSVVITAEDRFDPLVQQLLTRKQLDRHRHISDPMFVVLPSGNEQQLTETQIRYLERLLKED